jgi:nitrate reductase delta subunit
MRVLARLLSYPDAGLHTDLRAMRDALHTEAALGTARLRELVALMDMLAGDDPLDIEAAYVQLFDSGRATSLHLFEHVHGDSRERGPAMIDLAQTYAKAGLHLAPGELPDYLPVVLEFISTQPAREARAFLSEMAHILNALFSALQERQSAYASVLGALLELAGEKAQAVKLVPDEPLDESWMEPAVFDGCSSKGQAAPGQPQPVNIVRKADAARKVSTHPSLLSGTKEGHAPVGGSAHHARENQ